MSDKAAKPLRRLALLLLDPIFRAGEWWYRMTERRADEIERRQQNVR